MDVRRDALAKWAIAEIHQLENLDIKVELEPVSGDASFRRYFRLCHLQRSWIAVDAPADKEDNPKFIRIAKHWHQEGIAVPKVVAADVVQGFMLLEDLGDTLIYQPLHEPGVSLERVRGLYQKAINELLKIQQLPKRDLPPYSAELLEAELALFTDWLCVKKLGLELDASTQAMFARLFEQLVESALAQPQVCVHRDYHSRNIMRREDLSLAVIDFQDAVIGPVTYDLVSLLRDCYVRWPETLVRELKAYYWEKARPQALYLDDWDNFQRDFDWMGMQRHLKAAGIFARLSLRDGKDSYLADIPNTCQYLYDVSSQYPEFAEFTAWLQTVLLPKLAEILPNEPAETPV